MEFVSGENRSQTLLLPECLDDYVDDNNAVRVIDAYINGLNLIVDFEVTNQVNDKNHITPMAERAKEVLGTERITAVVDAGYESIQDIISATEQGVEVHVAGTDFDICVPAKEGEGQEITSHHKGRCVYIVTPYEACKCIQHKEIK